MVQPSKRTPKSSAATFSRSSCGMPWRRIEVSTSTSTRGRSPSAASSSRSDSRETVVITAGSDASSLASELDESQGFKITISPKNPSGTMPTSDAMPTAIVSAPRILDSSANRRKPKPYPLPLITGTMPGIAPATVRRCSRQRSPSKRSVTPLISLPQQLSPTFHVEVESLVQQRIQRQIPLTEVLHRLASGANLELDQPQMRIVGLQPLGNSAKIKDLSNGLHPT